MLNTINLSPANHQPATEATHQTSKGADLGKAPLLKKAVLLLAAFSPVQSLAQTEQLRSPSKGTSLSNIEDSTIDFGRFPMGPPKMNSAIVLEEGAIYEGTHTNGVAHLQNGATAQGSQIGVNLFLGEQGQIIESSVFGTANIGDDAHMIASIVEGNAHLESGTAVVECSVKGDLHLARGTVLDCR